MCLPWPAKSNKNSAKLKIRMLMENTKTSAIATKCTSGEHVMLPLESSLLPVKSPALITRELWQKIGGHVGLESDGECVDTLSFYVLFALLGLIGFDKEQRPGQETLLIPVAFESGQFAIRLTIHRPAHSDPFLVLSLPEESMAL